MRYLYFMEMGTRGHVIKHGKQSGNAESLEPVSYTHLFYAILANGVTYDAQKMLSDIHRQPQAA